MVTWAATAGLLLIQSLRQSKRGLPGGDHYSGTHVSGPIREHSCPWTILRGGNSAMLETSTNKSPITHEAEQLYRAGTIESSSQY